MNYNLIYKLAELFSVATGKTLYHGTSLKRAKKIMEEGLIPQAGSWVSSTYGTGIDVDGDSEDYEGLSYDQKPKFDLIFAADKSTLGGAVGGMIASIAADTGKAFHDITNEDVRALGAILVMYDAEGEWERKPKKQEEIDKWERSNPNYPTVEPGDYFREEDYLPERLLSGEPMIRLLKQHNLYPITTGPDVLDVAKKKIINHLYNYSELSIQDVMSQVNSMSDEEIQNYLYELRRFYQSQ